MGQERISFLFCFRLKQVKSLVMGTRLGKNICCILVGRNWKRDLTAGTWPPDTFDFVHHQKTQNISAPQTLRYALHICNCPQIPELSWEILPPVESKMGAVAYSPVSHPRSSNRACGFPAHGFPTGFTSRHTSGGYDHRSWQKNTKLAKHLF